MKETIHDYPAKYALMRAVLDRATLPAGAREEMLKFDSELAARGITLARRVKYFEILRSLAALLGMPFPEASREDLIRVFGTIETKPYSPWTKNTYRIIARRFWKWLKGNDRIYPPEVDWIKGNVPRSQIPLPRAEDLLTEDDIANLIAHAPTARDRAFISVLWETGTRIGEIGTLTLRDVRFDKLGGLLSLTGKTGQRQVRIIRSAPALAAWLKVHPHRGRSEARLWVTTSNNKRGRPLMYAAIRKTLRDVALAAGLRKRVNPHAFRHARATFLASHLTEFQMNDYLGWVQGSGMPATYVHLSGRDTDEALLRLNGIEVGRGSGWNGRAPRTRSRTRIPR